MTEKILILDFGSQYTQLIARAVREANVYCEITPFQKQIVFDAGLKGIILSGSPFSVNEEDAPTVDIKNIAAKVPVLGICYGAQLTANNSAVRVDKSDKTEYGRAKLVKLKEDILLKDVSPHSQVWMSHSDTIKELPVGFEILGTTESIPVAAFKRISDNLLPPCTACSFTRKCIIPPKAKKYLKTFLVNICNCSQDWTPAHFISDTVAALKEKIGDKRVIMALSGGVDSTVAATLIHKACGDNLFGIFVDNGVLRKGEFEQVLEMYGELGLNVKGIDAKNIFTQGWPAKAIPEAKAEEQSAVVFIDVFDQERSTYRRH